MATSNLISSNLNALDTANERLTQARAVLFSLECHGHDGADNFGMQHNDVMSLLWAARALVEQAQEATRNINMQGLTAA